MIIFTWEWRKNWKVHPEKDRGRYEWPHSELRTPEAKFLPWSHWVHIRSHQFLVCLSAIVCISVTNNHNSPQTLLVVRKAEQQARYLTTATGREGPRAWSRQCTALPFFGVSESMRVPVAGEVYGVSVLVLEGRVHRRIWGQPLLAAMSSGRGWNSNSLCP